ncbi:interleukin-31 receptor subunit alpha-like [Dendrobates tinctorius]|uniref:interleukin-31 receptor subunit alpha-like n=1 Tax=Dendrobates tinctorius TaxID=92724 RepID=UPI003CC95769
METVSCWMMRMMICCWSRLLLLATAQITENMDPPEILSLKSNPAKDSLFLIISWKRPTLAPDELDVNCSLRYKQLQDDHWDYTPDLSMGKEKEMSYNLSGLLPYTEYVAAVRCIGNSGQLLWSEWSTALSSKTPEKDIHAAIQGARIFPKMDFVLKGSNVTLHCKLSTSGFMDDVYWMLSPDVAPGPVRWIVNETVSAITIPSLSVDSVEVTCGIRTPREQILDRQTITSGYPPDTPKNVSCVYFYPKNITCSWIPRNDPKIPTTFHLAVRNDSEKKCSSTTNSCSFLVAGDQLEREYHAELRVQNGLGKATRQFTVNAAQIVKLDPPEILSLKSNSSKDPSFLIISWKRPNLAPDELDVNCSLRYKLLQDDQWDYSPDLYMGKEREMSYNLSGLLPYTEYEAAVRCIGNSGQLLWSEWSAALSGRTAEKAPTLSVELWRAISSTERTRIVYVKWKESSSIRSPGITLGYSVQWFPENRSFDYRNKTTNNNEMILSISEDAHIISVVYFNSAGRSPKATLRIPATAEKTRDVISSVRISTAAAEDTTVTWTVTDPRYQRFVLDWCIDSGVALCNVSFQYVENSSSWTFKKGTLEPYKRYRISVYPILDNKEESPYTIYFYAKEGAPLHGPTIKLVQQTKTEATIRWDPLRPSDTNGFITAFTVVYKPLKGQESVVAVNGNVYEYSLRSLMPDTLYIAYVIVSTSAGNTSGNHLHFRTLANGSEYIGALAGILGTCLLLLLMFGIIYKQKKEKIINLFWPNVPDPSLSSIHNWPSDLLQTVPFLNPLQTDGTLHSGDLHILHGVYVNDRRDTEPLLPDLWGSTEDTSTDEPFIVVNYAVTKTDPDSAASWPVVVRRGSFPSVLGDQTAAVGETPDLEPFTVGINPYLKHSVHKHHTDPREPVVTMCVG